MTKEYSYLAESKVLPLMFNFCRYLAGDIGK